jgi:hypothetical protein
MKTNSKTRIGWIAGIVAVGLAGLGGTASATLIAYEGFDYTDAQTVGGLSGGTGWTTVWKGDPALSTNTITGGTINITTPGSTTTGLQVAGNAATAMPTNNLVRAYRSFQAVSSGTVYFRMLATRLNSGTRFLGIQLFNGTSATGIPFFGMNSGQTNWSISTNITSGIPAATNVPALLVLRVDFNMLGTGSTNERVRLYVNPTPGALEPSTAAADSESNTTYNIPQIDRIGIGAGFTSGADSTTIGTLDEIRIGTTWADVVPPTPVIQNGSASSVTASSATLNGYLSSTGGAPITAVSVYWGTNDAGTVAANWGKTNSFSPAPQAVGPLSTNITGLVPNVRYYYRFYAANSYGGVWADPPVTFIATPNAIATGGNTTTNIGGYRIHTFTSSGTFSVTSPGAVEVLVVAGGGGGGALWGGGGGAGGLLYYGPETPANGHAEGTSYAVTGGSNYTVTIGGRGTGATSGNAGGQGGNSIFGALTAIGGGGGGNSDARVPSVGGSGGGAGDTGLGALGTAGQGMSGGGANYGGGGGAGLAGTSSSGKGGDGLPYAIGGTGLVYYAGGGGGAGGGRSGLGGGGSSTNLNTAGTSGVDGTGGGGGGGWGGNGGSGGSGIVIVRYRNGHPAIDSLAATSVMDNSATLNGNLTTNGLTPATVRMYWGTNDGLNVAANWQYTNDFPGPYSTGSALSTNITGLAANTQYYYRFYASNSVSEAWADPPASFFTDTAGLTVVATTPNASESGPVNGVFTLTRSTASTNAAMTVTYALAGTAINGTDYASRNGQATFPVGATNTTVTVIPIADGLVESSETVDLTLTGGGVLGSPSNATVTIADGTWYVSTNGVDTNLGTSWGQAFRTVSNGVARALAGDLVLVSNGVYNVTTNILVNKGITVRGVGGASNTFLRGPYPAVGRVLLMSHAAAVVDGFTITNGYAYIFNDNLYGGGVYLTAGTLRNCTVAGNRLDNGLHAYGGGIYATGGAVSDCIIRGNMSQGGNLRNGYGGGVYMTGGTLSNCRLEQNLSKGSGSGFGGNAYGGGVYITGSAQVLNSLIVSNRAQRTTDNYEQGGGVWMDNGTLANCTVVDNLCVVSPAAGSAGGGIYQAGGTVRNGIVYYNTSAGVANDFYWSAGTRDYSCAPELTTGTGNTTANPLFEARSNGNYRLTRPSPCVDTGTSSVGLILDLDGNPRPVDGDTSGVAQHDMGCYEYQGGVFACDFDTASATVVLDALNNAVFTASVDGTGAATNIAYYWWDFSNGTQEGAALPVVTNSFGPGRYTVTLTVSNTLGDVSSATKPDYIKVVSANTYVSTNGTGQYPYETWGKATTNPVLALAMLKEAFSSAGAAAGDMWLSNGVFGVSEQLVLNGPYRLHGVNGAASTAVRRSGAAGYRVMSLTHTGALVEGLTISNGLANVNGEDGGGVRMTSGTLRSCVIASNRRETPNNLGYGGGVSMTGGLMTNCTVRNNYAMGGYNGTGYGGGVYAGGGTIRDCRIEGNRLVGYYDNSYGGDAYGGGLYMTGTPEVWNSLIASNSVQRATNSSSGGTIERGGGVWMDGGNLVSCTVADNRGVRGTLVAGAGGGIYQAGGSVTNCIVYANTSAGASNNLISTAGTRGYSCAPELTSGTGNITGDPRFQRKAGTMADYYRLVHGTPCKDTGTNLTWMTNAVDLEGYPRIIGSRVNMGAYEHIIPGGTSILFR